MLYAVLLPNGVVITVIDTHCFPRLPSHARPQLGGGAWEVQERLALRHQLAPERPEVAPRPRAAVPGPRPGHQDPATVYVHGVMWVDVAGSRSGISIQGPGKVYFFLEVFSYFLSFVNFLFFIYFIFLIMFLFITDRLFNDVHSEKF